MIEMKRSVSRWMSLRKKTEYFRYRKHRWISLNNSRRSGRLKNRSDFNEACCPHNTICTKNLENDNLGQYHSGSINIGTNHRVLPLVGGSGAIPGGAHNNSNESPHMSNVQSDMIERWNLLFAVFGSNLRRATFTICSYFVAVGSLAADCGLL